MHLFPRNRALGFASATLAAGLLCACGTTVPQTRTIGGGVAVNTAQSGDGVSAPAAPGVDGASSQEASGGAPSPSGAVAVSGDTPVVSGSATTAGATAVTNVAGPGTATARGKAAKAGETTKSGGQKTNKTTGATTTPARSGAKPGAAPTGAAGSSPNLVNGPGVSASTINIGLVYDSSAGKEQAALGNTASAGGPDPKEAYTAYVKDVNAHGGIAGRQLNLIVYDTGNSSTETADQVVADICAYFTQDTHVLAVFGFGGSNLVQCLGKSGVVDPGTSGSAAYTDSELTRLITTWDVSGVSLDTMAKQEVSALLSDKYFTAWNTATGAAGGVAPIKVGVISPDISTVPGLKTVVLDYIVPMLRAKGIHVDDSDVIFWHAQAGTQNAGPEVAAISAAELQMAQDGVTHVIPFEFNSLAFFSQAANGQQYHPRYGLNTSDFAQAEYGSLIPTGQLNGALGFGMSPSSDLPITEASKPQYIGPGAKKCLAVGDAAGLNVSQTQVGQATAFAICDELYSFRDATNAVPTTQPLTAPNIFTGLKSLGTSFQIAASPTVSFGPNKTAGADRGFLMGFDTGCGCIQYTSSGFPLS